MFEKIIPVIIALIAVHFLGRYLINKRKTSGIPARDYNYKQRINDFMKMNDHDMNLKNERVLDQEIHRGLLIQNRLSEIPENMRDVIRDYNLIIDGVTHAVEGKAGLRKINSNRYSSPEKMFDEILDVVRKYKI